MFTKLKCVGVICLVAGLIAGGCKNSVSDPPVTALQKGGVSELITSGVPSVVQVNLVANNSSFSPARIDNNLLNAWGIAMTPTGRIWISSNHGSVSVIYDKDGNEIRPPVTIPTSSSSTGGAPTGVIFNSTTGFVIPSTGEVSRFIFASEDGIISAWASGNSAKVVADRSSFEAVYKGITKGWADGKSFIYATNFKGGTVDAFDDHFQYDSAKKFIDPNIPAGFAPFNIANIGGNLFVTYAKQKGPDNQDDESGPGNGYVDIFKTDGTLISRFASQGTLNSPWGLAKVPEDGFGQSRNAIIVGNFGDGRINLFDLHGKFVEQLADSQGNPIVIPGLWALAFGAGDVQQNDDQQGDDNNQGDQGNAQRRLFFTAGPNEEADGLFGYLKSIAPASAERDDENDGHD